MTQKKLSPLWRRAWVAIQIGKIVFALYPFDWHRSYIARNSRNSHYLFGFLIGWYDD